MSMACKECPFRKDSVRGHLADYTVKQVFAMMQASTYFPCHMTLPPFYEKDLDAVKQDVLTGKYPLCSGYLATMKKSCVVPRDPYLAQQVKQSGDNTTMLSQQQFLIHHKQE